MTKIINLPISLITSNIIDQSNIILELNNRYTKEYFEIIPRIECIDLNFLILDFDAPAGQYDYTLRTNTSNTNLIISGCNVLFTNCGIFTNKPVIYSKGVINIVLEAFHYDPILY